MNRSWISRVLPLALALLALSARTGATLIIGMETTPSWGVNGSAQALFGASVATAGDVNGDGYTEVIVGSPFQTGGAGRADLYLGGPSGPATSPSLTLTPSTADEQFGGQVACAGDVNGDGYSDVLVCASNWNGGRGRAYAYYGSASGLHAVADWIVDGGPANGRLGFSVATAGDVNGDGYDDVLVGAPFQNVAATGSGAAYLYLGSAGGLATTSTATLVTGNVNANLGFSVATAGDVNGDGFDDVVVGAPGIGVAYVYLGYSGGLGGFPASLVGPANFGVTVATAGDVTGDGYSDVVVGGQGTPGVRIYYGSASGIHTTADVERAVPVASVAPAGDLDGDGRAEVILGRYAANGFSVLLSSDISWHDVTGTTSGYGFSAATAGDTDGDGFAEVIVGARNDAGAGRAEIYRGGGCRHWLSFPIGVPPLDGVVVAPWIRGAGDVNGDGFDDLLVFEQLGVRILDGGSAPFFTPVHPVVAVPDADHPLVAAAPAGDVNGDGYADLLATMKTVSTSSATVFLFLGSSGGPVTSAAWSTSGSSNYGQWAEGVGDVNGDGYADVLVSNPTDPAQGAVFLFLGSSIGLSTTPSWQVTGPPAQAGRSFGAPLWRAGDVNGDGFSDFLIGGTEAGVGTLRLYLGAATGPSTTSSWTGMGSVNDGSYGQQVAAVDLNGDRFSDLIVGERGFGGGTEFGGLWIYYSGPSGPSPSPGASLLSAHPAQTIVSMGDMNGDGLGDFAIGHHASQWTTTLYAGPGFTTFTDQVYGSSPIVRSPFMVAAGDFDGDGGADLVTEVQSDAFHFALDGHFSYHNAPTLRPRLLRTDLVTPIAFQGLSNAKASVGLGATGRSTAGRSRVRLEWQFHPSSSPSFGAIGRGAWSATGVPASDGSTVPLTWNPSGLAVGAAAGWRLRVASRSPFFPHTRWMTSSPIDRTEWSFRTRPLTTDVAATPEARDLHLAVGPNPSHGDLDIRFALPRAETGLLEVTDVGGRRVATLEHGVLAGGTHHVTWSARDVSGRPMHGGIYFVHLHVGGTAKTQRIVLLN